MIRSKFGKKAFGHVLAFTLVFTLLLAGCGNDPVGTPYSGKNTVLSTKESSSKETEPTDESASGEDETGDGTETEESKTEEKKEPFVADRSAAFELLSNIRIGWNLGNTLDAHGTGNSLRSETYWGCPETTQEMLDAVAAQGFNAVRIPVTYAEHVGKAPDYVIKAEWLDRVQEVVDYAVNAGLYVILDTHHEPNYWLKPNKANEKAVKEELTAIWRQVAERFKDYDEKLMFEGMNEPRTIGSSAEWSGGTTEERQVVDHLNQAFIDAVRSTGGNNETRLLIICTYGHNAGYNVLKDLVIPEDNYVAVAVHMYTPYYFTFDGVGSGFYDAWDGSAKGSIGSSAKQLNLNLIQKDVPVIITEFGAVNKQNPDEIINWIRDYLQIMNSYGIKCFWWDNNCYETTGENFGIFNRRELSWYSKAIADALIEYSAVEAE